VKSLSSVESVTPGTIYWLDSFRCIHEMLETRDKVLLQCTEPIHIGKLCLLSSVFVMETKQISSEIYSRCCRTFNSGLYDMVQLAVKLKPVSKMAHSTEICSCREYRLFREVTLLSEIFFVF